MFFFIYIKYFYYYMCGMKKAYFLNYRAKNFNRTIQMF